MSTADQLRDAIAKAADFAWGQEPHHPDTRARCFIAALSGAMKNRDELELEQIVWALLSQPVFPASEVSAPAPQ